jgi:ribosome biogenesis GTPase A
MPSFKKLQDQLKWVDLIFEVRDARVPVSSGHPQSASIFGNKPRILVMAKEDLADPSRLKQWASDLTKEASLVVAVDLKEMGGRNKLIEQALRLTKDKQDARTKKGLLPRPIRACVVGMPNVGKSSLINWLIGKKKAHTGNKPGITKGPQWVRVHPQLELLDTPGILPVSALKKDVTSKLAMLNLVPDSHYDIEETAEESIQALHLNYPNMLANAYGDAFANGAGDLAALATLRSCLTAGSRPDTYRAATILLNDLRAGKLGRIILDTPLAGSKSHG